MFRIDPREDKPVVEHITTHLQKDIYVQIKKRQANYRVNCMYGYDHPLSIERQHYRLLTVDMADLDADALDQDGGRYYRKEYTPMEMEFFESILRKPQVEWAVDNSFDGIYILREEDMATFRVVYRFAVYLKEEQVTFWKLKFSGQ